MRLIDADKLIALLNKKYGGDDINESVLYLVGAISGATTVDAEPVKHGHWLFYEDPDGYYHTECSECGQWCDEDVFLKGKWHYCPNCGAKMNEKTTVEYYADNKLIQTTVINERREDEID